ncbi:MAG: hypothetical protein JWP12_3476 [Bacteroidetes bacterium]|nr:hypothetical protein [Bacteroidota bacterium]
MEEREPEKGKTENQKKIEIVESIEDKFLRELKEFETNGFVFANRSQIFYIGKPSQKLLDAGIPDLPIILTQVVVNKAIGNIKHKQDAAHEVKCAHLTTLPFAVQNPVIIIESITQPNSKVLFTEIKDAKRETVIVPN